MSVVAGVRRRARANPALALGIAIVGVIVLVAVFAPLLERNPPNVANSAVSLRSPGGAYWFGTDISGFDIYSRVVDAARIDLLIGLLGSCIAMAIGGFIGLVVGYAGGIADAVVSRIVDLLQSIPLFITALLLVTLFGQRFQNIVLAVTVVYLPLYVRTFRTEARVLVERGFVRSARISGASPGRVIFSHILPNSLGPAFGQWATSVGWAILMAAGLGFVGAGLKPPTAEWGSMISSGASLVSSGQWWVAAFPGLAIAFTVAGFTFLSEGLEQAMDPRRRGA
jgi:peptide/nickel transport system permease protein